MYMGFDPIPGRDPGTDMAYQQAASLFTSGNILGAAEALSPLGLEATGLSAGPIGAAVGGAIAVGLSLLHLIGKGRREADMIVPIQNKIGERLKEISNAIDTSVNVSQLQSLFNELQAIGQAFKEFVGSPQFRDGRASQQALNTIMPLIDGTAGYHWPPPWTAGQYHAGPSGGGEDGIISGIQRRILQLGTPMQAPYVTQGVGGGGAPFLAITGGQTFPWIPQAGTIPNNAPIYPLEPEKVSPIDPASSSAGLMGSPLLLLLIGGLVVTRFLRR